MVGTLFVAAAFGNSFRPLHHERPAQFAHSAGRFGFDGVLAFRIIGTAVKQSESAAPFGHHASFANRTRNAGGVLSFQLGVFFDVLAFRVITAGNESAETAVALY